VVTLGENRNTWSVLVGKREGKRAVGRPRRRWKNTTIMGLREIERHQLGDQKVSVRLMIAIQKVTSNVQSVPR
jgi:hypothetical protein